MRVITRLLVLSLLVVSCGDDNGEIALDAEDSGTTVQVTTGDVVTVELESNPSTGYSWVVPEDLGLLELRDERWVEDSELVGAPGTTHLEFEVTGTGTMTLDLEYRRPWLSDEPAERTFTITIVSA
jgi:inhibitor of cysteine peptidase